MKTGFFEAPSKIGVLRRHFNFLDRFWESRAWEPKTGWHAENHCHMIMRYVDRSLFSFLTFADFDRIHAFVACLRKEFEPMKKDRAVVVVADGPVLITIGLVLRMEWENLSPPDFEPDLYPWLRSLRDRFYDYADEGGYGRLPHVHAYNLAISVFERHHGFLECDWDCIRNGTIDHLQNPEMGSAWFFDEFVTWRIFWIQCWNRVVSFPGEFYDFSRWAFAGRRYPWQVTFVIYWSTLFYTCKLLVDSARDRLLGNGNELSYLQIAVVVFFWVFIQRKTLGRRPVDM